MMCNSYAPKRSDKISWGTGVKTLVFQELSWLMFTDNFYIAEIEIKHLPLFRKNLGQNKQLMVAGYEVILLYSLFGQPVTHLESVTFCLMKILSR